MSQTVCEAQFVYQYLKACDNNDDADARRVLQTLPIVMAANSSTAFCATLLSFKPSLQDEFYRLFPTHNTDYRYALLSTAVDALVSRQASYTRFLQILQTPL